MRYVPIFLRSVRFQETFSDRMSCRGRGEGRSKRGGETIFFGVSGLLLLTTMFLCYYSTLRGTQSVFPSPAQNHASGLISCRERQTVR